MEQATVIPIPKPGKNTSNPENNRPITLTSCPCRTLERIINNRLVWYLETNKLLSNNQCGYRKNRSCIDHITSLETYIREAFIRKQHVTTVFFDLEKSLRYNMAIWYTKIPTQPRSQRQTSTIYKKLSFRQELQRKSRIDQIGSKNSRRRCTSRQHHFNHPLQYQN